MTDKDWEEYRQERDRRCKEWEENRKRELEWYEKNEKHNSSLSFLFDDGVVITLFLTMIWVVVTVIFVILTEH